VEREKLRSERARAEEENEAGEEGIEESGGGEGTEENKVFKNPRRRERKRSGRGKV